ncbi:hypothetical protein NE237_019015 [Protea cynaroides]|uniref:Uncharacterized protein n=1 Tax=Protea cynaroides TaxID=273540 RepID=A0A9Q0KAZ0_9MAGN|nr:hypothetical protein NE237_019015 [Protea cynaroides]
MERNLSSGQRLPHSSGWVSSSCIPIPKDYSRLPVLEYSSSSSRSRKTINKWQSVVRRLAGKRTKDVYGTKRLTFHYDADSYARNFDEGVPSNEEHKSSVQNVSLQVDHKSVHEPI